MLFLANYRPFSKCIDLIASRAACIQPYATRNNRGAHSETGNLAERESGHHPRTSRSNGSAPCSKSVKPLLQAEAKLIAMAHPPCNAHLAMTSIPPHCRTPCRPVRPYRCWLVVMPKPGAILIIFRIWRAWAIPRFNPP